MSNIFQNALSIYVTHNYTLENGEKYKLKIFTCSRMLLQQDQTEMIKEKIYRSYVILKA